MRYGLAVLLVAAATALRWALLPWIGDTVPYELALPAVIIATVVAGIGPGLLATLVAVLATETFIVGPLGIEFDGPTVGRMGITSFVGTFLCYLLHAVRAAQNKARDELEAANAQLQAEIAERRQAEARITRLASFPELNPNPIVEVDLAGQIHYVNPGARRVFPDLPERGLDHPWLAGFKSIGGAFQAGQSRSAVREVTVGGRFYQQMVHWVEEGQRVRIYGMDVTERKRAEEALQKANEVLEVRVAERTAELRETLRAVGSLLPALF